MKSDFHPFTALIGANLLDRRYRKEVEEEILDHLESAAADWERAGLSPEEACHRAMADLGDPALIGHLLHTTGKGGLAMKRARFGGTCGILLGIFLGLNILADALIRNYRATIPTWFPTDVVIFVVQVMPVVLLILTLAGTYVRQTGSRVKKGALLAMLMVGGLIFLGGAAMSGLAVLGIWILSAAAALTGLFLAVHPERAERWMGAAIIVAGLSLPPFTSPVYAKLGHALGNTFGTITAVAWLLVGYSLLPPATKSPAASRIPA